MGASFPLQPSIPYCLNIVFVCFVPYSHATPRPLLSTRSVSDKCRLQSYCALSVSNNNERAQCPDTQELVDLDDDCDPSLPVPIGRWVQRDCPEPYAHRHCVRPYLKRVVRGQLDVQVPPHRSVQACALHIRCPCKQIIQPLPIAQVLRLQSTSYLWALLGAFVDPFPIDLRCLLHKAPLSFVS